VGLLLKLLDLVEESDFVYILKANGMLLGNDEALVHKLSKYKKLHVRVSIKGCNEDGFGMLKGA